MKKTLQQRYLDNNLSCLLTTTYVDGLNATDRRVMEFIEEMSDKPLQAVGTVKNGVINIYTKEK
jgi:hypothetical protein